MKNNQLRSNQAGIAHLGLLLLVLVVVGLIAFAGYRVMGSDSEKNAQTSSASQSKDVSEVDSAVTADDAKADDATLNKTTGTEANDE